MIADNVICNNCDSQMFIVSGTEVCPICKRKGFLSWVNEEQEIEVSSAEIINFDDYENVVNGAEEYINH